MPSLTSMARDARKKKTIPPKKSFKKVSPPPDLSNEFIQESDLEEDEKLDEDSTSDAEESLSDHLDLSLPRINGKSTAPAVDDGSSSESESESESEGEGEGDGESAEDSESEDDDQQQIGSPKKISKESKVSKPASSSATSVSFKAPPFSPPTGFELASVDGSSRAPHLFEKSNLQGKQIWYITAPASVPISTIKELSLAKIQMGGVVLSQRDKEYGFVADPSQDVKYTKVMVPNTTGDEYRTASRSIDRILKVKEIVQLPSVHRANTKEVRSSVRPQPPGLKMRFRPIGFGNGKLGRIGSPSPSPAGINNTSDEEMEDAPQQFHRPASLEREQSSNSDAEKADAPLAKPKPAVKSKHQKAAAKESSQAASRSLKRKLSEGDDMKVKNSSSNSINFINSQLNPVKKKQKSSPADNQSALIEAQKTASSYLGLPDSTKVSTSQILAPRPNHSRALLSPLHIFKSTGSLPSVNLSYPSQTSLPVPKPSRESLTKDRASVVDADTQKRKKEDKILEKEQAELEASSELAESQEKKHKSKEEKKRKKRKKVQVENERVRDARPTAYKSDPILPPKRSLSMIPPPKGIQQR